MLFYGLTEYGLTPKGFSKLGARSVRFNVQLKGIPLARLVNKLPRQRDADLRAALKRQYAQLVRAFPEGELTSRDERKGSWTLDGKLPASRVADLAARPEVAWVWVEAIAGRRKQRERPKLSWFCVWGVVAIQIEGQKKGTLDLEDRLMLVKAYDADDAVKRLRPEWAKYAKPYLNPKGYLVRWKLISVQDVYDLLEDELSPKVIEVYSRLRAVKMKPEYQWLPKGK
jgi:Domain of unknown function (DUF4288)